MLGHGSIGQYPLGGDPNAPVITQVGVDGFVARRRPRGAALQRAADGPDARFVKFFPSGWEVAPIQPPHRRPERAAAIMPSPNIDAKSVNFFPHGWPVQPIQPRHPRPEKSAALIPGDDGNEGRFNLFVDYGWPVQPPQPPHPKPERFGAISPWADIPAVLAQFFPLGWEVAPPMQPRWRAWRQAGMMIGEDGIAGPLILFRPAGWDVRPHQPSHPRPERAGAIARGDDGNEGPFVFVPAGFVTWGYDIQTWQPRVRVERAAAVMAGDPGIQAAFLRWQNAGWAAVLADLRRRSPVLDFPDLGVPAPVRIITFGLDRPEHVALRRRAPAFNGIETFPPPHAFGWFADSPPQATAMRRRTIGASDDGLVELISLPPFTFMGWESVLQPPSHRWYKSAVITREDDGATFFPIFIILAEAMPSDFPAFLADAVDEAAWDAEQPDLPAAIAEPRDA